MTEHAELRVNVNH